jgi:uncharacterized membrane protein YphA (DoxX/SURF4 family)
MTTEAAETTTPAKKSPLRYVTAVVRFLLGLVFVIFGLNGFLHFMPEPPPESLPEGVKSLMGAFIKSGYMFPLIAGTQLISGVLLLINLFVPLALVLLAPVIVNIILFHIFLAPSTIGPGVLVAILELYLAWAYRKAFCPMLRAKTIPG